MIFIEIFAKAEKLVAVHIQTWGYQKEKRRYFQVLAAADVVVSTSKHEFFGVAVYVGGSLFDSNISTCVCLFMVNHFFKLKTTCTLVSGSPSGVLRMWPSFPLC